MTHEVLNQRKNSYGFPEWGHDEQGTAKREARDSHPRSMNAPKSGVYVVCFSIITLSH